MDHIYLNILWHQHQPLYKDPIKDTYTAPWVRLHATKDYYDMAAILLNFPKVKVTINLTPSLLIQIQDYIEKMKDYADEKSPHYLDEKYFPYQKLDRALDLLFKPVSSWTNEDKEYAKKRFFDAHYDSQIAKYPAYKKLYDKVKNNEELTNQDFLNLKVWFNLVWFDYDFLTKEVELIGQDENNNIIKDKVTKIKDIYLKGIQGKNFTEQDAIDIILESYKIMKFVIPIHRYLQNKGQIEITTTPFYHPILPLIDDTNVAKESNPNDNLPNQFKYPEDADIQVKLAAEYYKKIFGKYPVGMWPGEGAVSENIIKHFVKNGVKWIATGNEVVMKSGYAYDVLMPYRVDVDKEFIDNLNNDALTVVPRSLHDKIGWDYGYYRGKLDGADAAKDYINFVKSLKHIDAVKNEPIFITNTCDGENVWTYYQNDGKDFLLALYDLINKDNQIITMTPKEFITTIKPIDKQWELEPLATGSWVYGDLSTWIGEDSENKAWNMLNKLRQEFIKIPLIDEIKELKEPDKSDRTKYYLYRAWHTLFASEGSDWFWWYGNDWDSGNDQYFARLHRVLMVNALKYILKAGYNIQFPSLIWQPLDQDNSPLPPTMCIFNIQNNKFFIKIINPLNENINLDDYVINIVDSNRNIVYNEKLSNLKQNENQDLLVDLSNLNLDKGEFRINIINTKNQETIDSDYIIKN